MTGREADHLPPKAEVKKGGAVPPLLYITSSHSAEVIKHMDKFTFQEEISRFSRETGTPYEKMSLSLSLSFFYTVTETKHFSLCISSALSLKKNTAHYLSLCTRTETKHCSLPLSLALFALSLKQNTAHYVSLCTLTEKKTLPTSGANR